MQKTDILVGIGVIAVVAMLIIPIPTFLLDFLRGAAQAEDAWGLAAALATAAASVTKP